MEWLTTSMCAAPVRARRPSAARAICAGDVDVRRVVVVVDGVDLGVAVALRAQRRLERVPPAARPPEAVHEQHRVGSRPPACFRCAATAGDATAPTSATTAARNTRRRSTGAR